MNELEVSGIDLAEGERLLSSLTPGPWVAVHEHIDQHAPHPDGNRILHGGSSYDDYSLLTSEDVTALVWLRNNGLALIERLRQLEKADPDIARWAKRIRELEEQVGREIRVRNNVIAELEAERDELKESLRTTRLEQANKAFQVDELETKVRSLTLERDEWHKASDMHFDMWTNAANREVTAEENVSRLKAKVVQLRERLKELESA